MIKIKASIYLYKNKGRKKAIADGYRPAFQFEHDDNYYTGHIELIGKKSFELGIHGEVFITFTQEEKVSYLIKEGKSFTINEPPIEIGEGEILQIIS